jgi:sugar fermentation stimulation protein A
MKYDNVCRAVFLERLNRFVARVELDGRPETVHVKNTGRLRELLVPGSEVWLTRSGNPERKTQYDLIAVRKQNGMLFNIDSQAANAVTLEWLRQQDWDEIRPEYTYGASRVDFFMRKGTQKHLMEVKGCTLERDGVGFFPDAPTERGAKHLRELANAKGYQPVLTFVIQMDGITEVRGNRETDPVFCEALEDARKAGVKIIFLPCHVETDELTYREVPGMERLKGQQGR